MTEVLFPPLSKEEPDARGCWPPGSSRDGDRVEVDQLLAEVQVDKVAAEVPAPVAGVVHLLVEEEEAVRQGAAIARIG